jgi:hypothetical protein
LTVTLISMIDLAACQQTAKEDPVEEQIQQRQTQQPEPSQPREVEPTDGSIGKNIEG